jgi:hypothetical protein
MLTQVILYEVYVLLITIIDAGDTHSFMANCAKELNLNIFAMRSKMIIKITAR